MASNQYNEMYNNTRLVSEDNCWQLCGSHCHGSKVWTQLSSSGSNDRDLMWLRDLV